MDACFSLSHQLLHLMLASPPHSYARASSALRCWPLHAKPCLGLGLSFLLCSSIFSPFSPFLFIPLSLRSYHVPPPRSPPPSLPCLLLLPPLFHPPPRAQGGGGRRFGLGPLRAPSRQEGRRRRQACGRGGRSREDTICCRGVCDFCHRRLQLPMCPFARLRNTCS